MKIPICTTLEKPIYEEIKQRQVAFNTLIYMGLQSFKGNPAILQRQRELEDEIHKLQNANKRLQTLVLEATQ